ncbi:heparan-alpha-glucosaminide N-acetyltransferase [Desulfitibacter alkalitolerans]|uniref:heparan-alpha-glucosaminide N-acetyltransferase n=1 Tax=Desulfitibacter alkalitolerans TaxID=264641 RepID=UPI000483AD8D|nr:heparan-alpha-glucosaminide N-acetyltransferase [Desulfitibacter alkalitolerans]
MSQAMNMGRVGEIDFFRGIALILMIFFHIIWDLNEFYNFPIEYSTGIVFIIGKAAAYLFIIITAISCSFSKNNRKRGMKILAVAMVITLATYIYDPQVFIAFGILHFLGVSVLLYPVYRKLNNSLLLLTGTIMILVGQAILTIPMSHDYLLFIGLTSPSYYALDYYPLLPYSGLFLYGIFLARILYPEKRSLFRINLENNPVSMIGKKTLIIYLLHQPVILAVLYILQPGGRFFWLVFG